MTMCLGVFLFGSNFFGTLWASRTCVSFSFTRLGKFLVIISSNRFSIPCSVYSPSDIPMMQMLLHFMLSKMFLNLSLFFFSFCCSCWVLFSTLSSKSLIQSSASSNLLFFPSSVLFIQTLYSLFLTGPFYSFYVIFHALQYTYNHYSKLSIW